MSKEFYYLRLLYVALSTGNCSYYDYILDIIIYVFNKGTKYIYKKAQDRKYNLDMLYFSLLYEEKEVYLQRLQSATGSRNKKQ